jgi:hypothetical protein
MALNIPIPFNLPTPSIPNHWKNRQAQQDVIGKELENVFKRIQNEHAPEDYATTFEHRRAQSRLGRAQAHGLELEAPYVGRKAEALVKHQEAQAMLDALKAQKLQAIIPYLQQALGGGAGQPPTTQQAAVNAQAAQQAFQQQQPQGTPNIFGAQNQPSVGPMSDGSGMPQQGPGGAMQPGMPGGAPQQPPMPGGGMPQQPGGNYLGNAILAHELGLQNHPGQIVDGQYIQQDPITGQLRATKVGPSDAEKVMTQEEAKYTTAADEGARNAIEASYAKEPIFQELMEIVNDPNFYKATGSFSDKVRKLTNNKDVNALAGKLNNLLGDIVNKSSKQFGARLNKAEYTALQRMKGSSTDNPYELKAKVQLMDALSRYEMQVNQEYLKNRKAGMNRDDALDKANASADYSQIRNIVKNDDMAHKIANKNKIDYSSVMRQAEKASKDFNVPLEEVLKEMQNG